MKFAELAGNMWDDAGAARAGAGSRSAATRSSPSPRTRRPSGSRPPQPVIDALDQAGEGQGPRRRQADRAGQGAGGQVRQGVSVCRQPRALREPSLRAATGAGCLAGAWGGEPMSDASDSGAGASCARRSSSACRASSPCSAGCCCSASPLWWSLSVLGRWLSGMPLAAQVPRRLGPINGDFELVQMATAIAVFSFLPYCQARRGNIVVDTFTSWLPRARQRLHRCVLGPRLRRHDGPAHRLPGGRRDRALPQRPDHHAAAAHRLAGDRDLHALLSLLLTCVALATAVRLIRGAP